MRDLEAEVDSTLRPFDRETESTLFRMRLSGEDRAEISSYVSLREDQRAVLAGRIRRRITIEARAHG